MSTKSPPDLSKAQRRFLRTLKKRPGWNPQRGRTRQTKQCLLDKGCLRIKTLRGGATKLIPLWDPDAEEWLA